ncbi:MAG: hypothetical protein JNL82_16170 [Myxococcales bacterium]|nr:hypothetical protein [Myxococcales bacterium]
MTTQMFRVVRVRSAAQSPVVRIEAVDEDGHELRLEVPVAAARGAGEGQLLLVHWSLHNQASAPAPNTDVRTTNTRPAAGAPQVIVDAEFTTSGASRVPQDPAAVDHEFMLLMNGGRSGKTFTSRDIDDELSTLLGTAGAKGQK